jgi:hypothetical protein
MQAIGDKSDIAAKRSLLFHALALSGQLEPATDIPVRRRARKLILRVFS